ncbi:Rid family hydrolase [Solicola sp. PLA-1-18]|uniref:Rid family hydrolase n=1 Tax=Solicola sp. PLA-1-18 TaxID=3380532 RepID=UPI003B7FFDA7
MSNAQYFATPGYGETMLANLHYHQAVRVGDRVEISGQGGWGDEIDFPDDLGEEIVRAFDNVERTLATAGASWDDVISIDSFHVPTEDDSIGDAHNRVMVDQLRRRFGDRAPIWTQIGVAALGAPGMRVEIRVSAVLGQGR